MSIGWSQFISSTDISYTCWFIYLALFCPPLIDRKAQPVFANSNLFVLFLTNTLIMNAFVGLSVGNLSWERTNTVEHLGVLLDTYKHFLIESDTSSMPGIPPFLQEPNSSNSETIPDLSFRWCHRRLMWGCCMQLWNFSVQCLTILHLLCVHSAFADRLSDRFMESHEWSLKVVSEVHFNLCHCRSMT